MSYTKLNPKNGETQVNDTTMKHLDDGIYDIDQNKIDKSTIELLTVDSTAPATCSEGDMYYNTTTNLIYTATGTDTWGTTGETPSSKYLYVDLTNSKLYYYDGATFTSYGGGSSNDVVISQDQPTSEDWKLWIDTGEVGSQVSEITNEYSTSTGLGYSANYVNNLHTYSTDEVRVGTWIDGKPLYRKVFQYNDLSQISSGSYGVITTGLQNVRFVKFEVTNFYNNVSRLMPYNDGTNSLNIVSINNDIRIYIRGTVWNDSANYLIVSSYYTKTTD